MTAFYELGVNLNGAGRGVSAGAIVEAANKNADEKTRLLMRTLTLKSNLKSTMRTIKPS
jgi:hypothetical protein